MKSKSPAEILAEMEMYDASRTVQMNFRCSEIRKKVYVKAAEKYGFKNLSEWVFATLDEAVRRGS